jgi:hypothetical protein
MDDFFSVGNVLLECSLIKFSFFFLLNVFGSPEKDYFIGRKSSEIFNIYTR